MVTSSLYPPHIRGVMGTTMARRFGHEVAIYPASGLVVMQPTFTQLGLVWLQKKHRILKTIQMKPTNYISFSRFLLTFNLFISWIFQDTCFPANRSMYSQTNLNFQCEIGQRNHNKSYNVPKQGSAKFGDHKWVFPATPMRSYQERNSKWGHPMQRQTKRVNPIGVTPRESPEVG